MKNSHIIVSAISFIAAIYCIAALPSGFKTVAMLPLFFSVGFMFLFPMSFRSASSKITVALVYSLFFMRMVFIPVYGIIDGYFSGEVNSTLANYCSMSVGLSLYEFVIVCVILSLAVFNKKSSIAPRSLSLAGNKTIYSIIILVALVLFVTRGRNMGFFEFGFKSIGGDLERSGDVEEGGILRMLISLGITFFYLLLTSHFAKRYRSTSAQKYVTYSIIIAMVMISIISGERRTSQIYKGFACIWLLIGLYPFYKKKVTSSLVIVAAVVIAGMTLYKQYHAFLYETYAEALTHARGVGMRTGMLDAYFYGINTISKNLAFADMGHLSITNLLYDFARNTFGINYIVPRGYPLTSELYNLTLSYGEAETGYLLSSVGYGYAFLGFGLAPVFTCFNVLIMLWLEKAMRSTSSIEMSYIWAFLFMRFSFGFLGSFPPLINLTSRMLLVNGGIVLIATFFNKSKNRVI